MFWESFHEQTELEKLLEQGNFTLDQILDQSNLVDFCRAQNEVVIKFLSQPEIVGKLLDSCIVSEANVGNAEIVTRSVRATDVLCVVDQCSQCIVNDEGLLRRILGFLDVPKISNILARNVCTLLGHLTRKSTDTLVTLFGASRFPFHVCGLVGNDFVAEMLIQMMDESNFANHRAIMAYFQECNLIPGLMKRLNEPNLSAEALTNIRLIVREIIAQKSTPTVFDTLYTKVLLTKPAFNFLVNVSVSPNEPVRTEGLALIDAIATEAVARGSVDILDVSVAVIPKFDALLVAGNQKIPTASGGERRVVGRALISAVRAITTIVLHGSPNVKTTFAKANLTKKLIDLFFAFPSNAVLSSVISSFAIAAVRGECGPVVQSQLLIDSNILSRTIENVRSHSAGTEPVTNVAFAPALFSEVKAAERSQVVAAAIKACPDYSEFVSGELAAIENRNNTLIAGGANTSALAVRDVQALLNNIDAPLESSQTTGHEGFDEQEETTQQAQTPQESHQAQQAPTWTSFEEDDFFKPAPSKNFDDSDDDK
eukprot:c6963_g1_i2.p1 GENE.c6963_g1_i2~~c6963_g1_i2.p1  ORF type:complete len:550 (+),score=173.23 c6963_g1_i2:31-1650(+)